MILSGFKITVIACLISIVIGLCAREKYTRCINVSCLSITFSIKLYFCMKPDFNGFEKIHYFLLEQKM